MPRTKRIGAKRNRSVQRQPKGEGRLSTVEKQLAWGEQIHASAYTINGFCAAFSIQRSTLMKWLPLKGAALARNDGYRKMEAAMKYLNEEAPKRLEKHPSRGYATEAQWQQLQALGMGPERNKLLEQIEQQTKYAGKIFL